jgi:RNA-directed DNA polymerase
MSPPTLSPKLSREPEELERLFFSLHTPQDVGDLLELPYRHLLYILYRGRHRYPYRTFHIRKKSGGAREISAPHPTLQILQSKLNAVLQLVYRQKPSAHGFVAGRSIVSNAHPHVGRRFVLNVDLEDFFPSINFGRVRGTFMAKPYNLPPSVATVLAQICCYEGRLPQGAPTSPIASNMVCAKLDGELQGLAKTYRCTYTRYADDITFSTTLPKFPRQLATAATGLARQHLILGPELVSVIESNGFRVNASKQRLQFRDQHQEVTGLTVNRFPNVRRRLVRQVRAMIHAWTKYGLEGAEGEFRERYGRPSRRPGAEPPSFRRVLRGKLDFLKMVKGESDPAYRRFRRQLHALDPHLIDDLPDQPSIEAVAAVVEHQRPDVASHAAPDGTVTIFFSDIECSTALNARLGDRQWMVLLREHNAIVRSEVASHGGYEVKTIGDAFMLAFRSAADALRCAMAIQRAFAERNRTAETPIRVRIGMHTGEPVHEAGDFYGYHVNYASRIADRAKGNEILVSSLLRDVIAPSGEFTLEEREAVRLKGLKGLHKAYAVAWSNGDN